MELSEARKIINEIDEQLVALFARRMETVIDVAKYKKENGMAVLDRSREHVVLDRAEALAGEELGGYARALYECLMALSRDYQKKLLALENDLPARIDQAAQAGQTLTLDGARVVCLNDAAAQIACSVLVNDADIVFARHEDMLFELLQSGVCPLAVIEFKGADTARCLAECGLFAVRERTIDGRVWLLVMPRMAIEPGANRFSLYLTLNDEPGALLGALEKLAYAGLNVTGVQTGLPGEVLIMGEGTVEKAGAALGAAAESALSYALTGWVRG